MRYLFIILVLVFNLTASAETDNNPNKQAKALVTKAMWTLDGLDYAIENNLSGQACQSLGAIKFITSELKSRTFEDGLLPLSGNSIQEEDIKKLILSLPRYVNVCSGATTLSSEDVKTVEAYRNELKPALEMLLDIL